MGDKTKIKFIIDYLIEHEYRVDVDMLHENKLYYEYADHDLIGKDFNRILRFMSKYKMIDIIDDNGYYLANINENTQDVQNLGIDNYIKMFEEKNKVSYTDNSINVGGDNKGFISQDSDFSNSPIKIKTTAQPTNKPDKKSFGLKTWELISNNKLITGIIFLILEEFTLGGVINLFKIIFN